MTTETVLRLGVFFGIFLAMALWERGMPMRLLQKSPDRNDRALVYFLLWMRAMKYCDHIVKLNCRSRAFSFLDIGTASFQQCLDIIPFNTGLFRSGEDSIECLAVLLSHIKMILSFDITVKLNDTNH